VKRYIETALNADEKILFDAPVHWAIYIWPAFICVMGLIGLVFSAALYSLIPNYTGPQFSFIGSGIVFFGVFRLINAFIYVRTSDFVLTDKRVIAKFGLLSRSTHEQRLSKIESINIYQSLLGRLLNFGNITIKGTGSSATSFGPTPDPLACKRAIETQLNLSDEKA
jgi:uncharacterized membrane protein YdbT with pleckstrin-like domain